ncbi:hypothetical protein GCM10022204_40930 [Microlunatus aurantiacus]|uniref:Uncharacterized protein n=1 Tax=Microlunatus aurantiacus TaxID=446786 RepID=A0ABP7EDA5_9ACTN
MTPAQHTPTSTGAAAGRRGSLATAWQATSATFGALLGLVPHVLHHVGILIGAALLTGVGGNLLLGLLGLLLSVPLLRRLYRRFRTWKAPAIALVIFVIMYALSAFVIGPAISSDPSPTPAPAASPAPTPTGHSTHHGG